MVNPVSAALFEVVQGWSGAMLYSQSVAVETTGFGGNRRDRRRFLIPSSHAHGLVLVQTRQPTPTDFLIGLLQDNVFPLYGGIFFELV